MARTRYLDYRAEDSTELLNDTLRGILMSGVYLGYVVGLGGSGGWWLKFTHDTDPDNTGEVLGVIVTPDGVIIQENANQDDIVLGAAPGGADEIHWVVASYTYNKALPNNDVVYLVKTAVAPATPTLTDDEVLLAEIDVPTGSISYASAGVDVKTVAKKDIYDINLFNLFSKFADILDPGIYEGMNMTEGSTDLKIHLEAGTWITKESAKIVEAVQQADLFTLTDPNAGNYALVWAIGAHKNEDTNLQPDVDYFIVEGAAVAVGTEAVLPSDGTILAAATAIDAKYDIPTYINKLGIVRVRNVGGVSYVIDYIKGETVLDPNTITVYGAQANSFDRSGQYYGPDGLIQAVSDIYDKVKLDTDEDEPYTILLDGEFKMSDAPLHLPSRIRLKGLGAPAIIRNNDTDPVVSAEGKLIYWNTVNDVIAVPGAGASTPPAGYVAKTFAIEATYQTGYDLEALRLCAGDPMWVWSEGSAALFQATLVEVTGAWAFELWIQNTYANEEDLDILFMKRQVHLENLEIDLLTTGNGLLTWKYLENCGLDKVKCYTFETEIVLRSVMKSLHVVDAHDWSPRAADGFPSTSPSIYSADNKYGRLVFDAAAVVILNNERGAEIGSVVFTAAAGPEIELYSGVISVVSNKGSGPVWMGAIMSDVRIIFVDGTIDNNADIKNYRVLFSTTSNQEQEFGEHGNQDRNLSIVSDANIAWDLGSNTLSWDAVIDFDLPFTTGYTRISIGSISLTADGDRAYINISRSVAGVGIQAPAVLTKAATATEDRNPHIVFFAVRAGDVIYLYDGTRIEDGQSVKVGATPPPDGSVTYPKLADSAVAYWDKFMRSYVAPPSGDGWDGDMIFRNTVLATLTYTNGRLQYNSPVDLSAVEALFLAGQPMYVVLRNTEHDPGVAGKGGYTFEEILAVTDSTDRIRISAGLDITTGAANIWNGAIAIGGKVVTNDDLTPFSYDAQGVNPGRVTYTAGLGFGQYQVRPGYIWKDSSGVKYEIVARDTSGLGDWIEIHPGLRDVDTSTPTTKHHGSVELNNNPYGLSFDDKRTLIGAEFIPIDTYGQQDIRAGEENVRQVYAAGFNPFVQRDRRFSTPYDDRIRVWVQSGTRLPNLSEPGDKSDNKRWMYGHGAIEFVEFTGVCTGAVLVVSGATGAGALSTQEVIVDGLEYASQITYHSGDYDQLYGVEYNRYELCHCTPMARLPQHVHHLRWALDTNIVVRGVLIFNAPNDQEPGNYPVTESPGESVIRGGIVETVAPLANQLLPTPSSGWNKGGRAVRYIDSDGVHFWAATWVRNFTDAGDATGGVNVTNVVSPTSWRVGDLVMMVDDITAPGSWTKHVRRIITIVGTTVTLNVGLPVGFIKAGAIMYYYGHGYQAPASDRNHDRRTEEVAIILPMNDFATPGAFDDSYGTTGLDTGARAVRLGSRLSDLTTGIAGDIGIKTEAGGRIKIDAAGLGLRFVFVGTGLSLRHFSNQAMTMTVDGVALPDLTASGSDTDDDQGGSFICGELPYGTHVVELTMGGVPTSEFAQLTIWQPKKPTIPADMLELLDVNLVSDSEADEVWAGTNALDSVSNSVSENQIGTINMQALPMVHAEGTGIFYEDWMPFNNSFDIRSGFSSVGGATTAAGDHWYFPFYGDEITVRTNTFILGAGNPLDVAFMDSDGQFRAPSALTGFATTSGSLAGDTLAAGAGVRHRWKLDSLRFHVLRITAGNANDNISFDGVEIHCPFHVNKPKAPITTDHFMPYQFSGLDIRNLVPFDASMIPLGQFEHTQGIWVNDIGALIDQQIPFVFYSKGGPTEVSVSVRIRDTGGGGAAWYMEIDGVFDGPPVYPNTNIGVIEDITLHATRLLTLAPGFHYARLASGDNTDTVKDASWRARYVTVARATYLQSRGLGVPGFGPSSPNESAI